MGLTLIRGPRLQFKGLPMKKKEPSFNLPVLRKARRGTIEDLEELLFYGNSLKSIQAILGMQHHQLEELCLSKRGISLTELQAKCRGELEDLIRRLQIYHAAKNPQLVAFLGKNLLGQRENPEVLPEFTGGLVEVVDRLAQTLEKKTAQPTGKKKK